MCSDINIMTGMADRLVVGARITSDERDQLVALVRTAIQTNTKWWILETADEKPDRIKEAKDEANRAHGALLHAIYRLSDPELGAGFGAPLGPSCV